MTEKLYDADGYLFLFSASVLSCNPGKDGWEIVLDRTAFFPEGGGQGGDRGMLDDVRVTDTLLRDDVIFHIADAPVPPGKTVFGQVEEGERFRRMQNHSGEHIVSGIIHSMFGLENVGFHLGDREMTMDYSGELTWDDLRAVELAANRAVWENREICCHYPSPEELSALVYRSKKELTGKVRIVTIEGVDTCACCAPHVKRTGEIGGIFILDSMRWKGGIRIRVRCGQDALKEYDVLRADEARLSSYLSAPRGNVFPAAEKLQEDFSELRREYRSVMQENALLRLERISPTEGNICFFLPCGYAEVLGAVALKGQERCTGVFVCLCGTEAEGYRYVIASSKGGLWEKRKEINAALNGRGGGADHMIQGLFSATKQDICDYFKEITL